MNEPRHRTRSLEFLQPGAWGLSGSGETLQWRSFVEELGVASGWFPRFAFLVVVFRADT